MQNVIADIAAGNLPLRDVQYVTIPDDSTLRALSYQSVFFAFNNWLLGTISNGLTQQKSLVADSHIMSTVLLQARELRFLMPQHSESILRSIYHTDLQTDMTESGDMRYNGLSATEPPMSNQSLATMLQELFINTTISLLSSTELQLVTNLFLLYRHT